MAQKVTTSPHYTLEAGLPTTGLPLSAVFERLRQLKAWQQQQQDTLLRHQQEQLLKLRNEQAYQRSQVTCTPAENLNSVDSSTVHVPPTTLLVPSTQVPVSNGFASETETPPNEREFVPLTGEVDQLYTELSHDSETDNFEECSGGSYEGREMRHGSPERLSPEYRRLTPASPGQPVSSSPVHMDDHLDEIEEDKPIKPAIGSGAVTSFVDYVEAQMRDHKSPDTNESPKLTRSHPFLKRGEGIARFGMKQHLKPKKLSKSNSNSSAKDLKPAHCTAVPKSSEGSLESRVRSTKVASSDELELNGVSLAKGLVRKVARAAPYQYSSVESLHQDSHCPRESTPAMTRCSSEDSFIIRNTQRSKWEEDELREFELLEKAAAEISLSQTSLLSQPHTVTHHTPPTPHTTNPPQKHHEEPSSHSPTSYPNAMEPFAQLHTDAHQFLSDSEGDPVINEDNELDDTLRASPPPSASLAAGMEFNDEEAWESFTRPSPDRHSFGSRSTLDSMEDEQLVQKSVEFGSRNGEMKPNLPPVEPANHIHASHSTDSFPAYGTAPTLEHSSSFHPGPSHLQFANSTEQAAAVLDPVNEPIPLPSSLISKLFPALRKEKTSELNKPTTQTRPPRGEFGPPSAMSPRENSAKTPSPTQSIDGESGKGSSLSSASNLLGDELRLKLCQLETEIERYKTENTKLERLRRDREEGLSQFKQEVAEFQRQKDEEVRRFEEYKREEWRKLRKERKVFETHQQEAKTVRDKRDREEIEQLRKQLSNAKEELEKRESRWNATLTRYRKKLEELEAQNKELQDDLRVMEQERLHWWHEQMEEKENRLRNKPKNQGSKPRVSLKETPSNAQNPPLKTSVKSTSKPSLLKSHSEPARLFKKSSPKKLPPSKPKLNPQIPTDTDDSPVNMGRKENAEKMEEQSDTSDLEIVDVVSHDIDRSDSSVGGYQSDSELSLIADDIVNDVMGVPSVECVELSDRQRRWSSPPSTVVSSGREQRVKTNKVTFSTQPEDDSVSVTPTQVIPEQQLPVKNTPQISGNDGNVTETTQPDGSKVIQFSNGTRKVMSSDGCSLSVYFFNGDIKHVKPDHTVVYYYADSKTTHTTFPDGLQVLDFPNHQTEKHYPNGTKEITFPDKTVKFIYPNGEEESVFCDGNTQRLYPNGDLMIQFTNGQKEFHTKEYKRREYPDGTIKTVYPDGKQETRYSSGRVRIKDKTGKVLLDRLEQNT